MFEDNNPAPAVRSSVVDRSIIDAALADAQRAATLAADTAAPNAPPAALPAPPVNYAAAAVDLVEFAGALFFPIYPSLEKVYDKETRGRIAAPLGQVMEKYRLDLGALGCELALAITLIPTIAPAAAAIRADRQRSKGATHEPQKTETGQTNPNGATIGAEATAENPLSRFPTI